MNLIMCMLKVSMVICANLQVHDETIEVITDAATARPATHPPVTSGHGLVTQSSGGSETSTKKPGIVDKAMDKV